MLINAHTLNLTCIFILQTIDERFDKLDGVLNWLKTWKEETDCVTAPAQTREKMFISKKCYDDLASHVN